MNIQHTLSISEGAAQGASKAKLLGMFFGVRQLLFEEREMHKVEVAGFRTEIEKLTREKINKEVNQPSSKKPEWDKDGKPKKKRKKRKRRRKGRKGAGNRAKPEPDVLHENPLSNCPQCQNDLSNSPVIETLSRIVEDIAPPPEKTIVSKEVQQSKWCSTCQEVVCSRTEAALPKSDIGLNTTALIAYLWVFPSVSLPGIAFFLRSFFRLTISTAGISRMMIRLGQILAPVHDEILKDVKDGAMIFADETGWRVRGKLWWLWIFANSRSAYYWPDRQRGSPVVAKILGDVFAGVLITDAWCAYHKILCMKQTCMAHILRKVRKFRDAYPEYYTIVMFYKRLRRIVEDGEKLRRVRAEIGEQAFARRLELLKKRLRTLLCWKNPNSVLKEVIKKVARQEAYILTFVSYEGVPTHNNFGEYVIKKGILKRKVSGGSMSAEGAMAYARIQSVAMTCHLRGLSFLDYLQKCLIHYIRTGKALLLREYEQQCSASKEQEKIAA